MSMLFFNWERSNVLFSLLLLFSEDIYGIQSSECSRKENDVEWTAPYNFLLNKTAKEINYGTLLVKKKRKEEMDSWITVYSSSDRTLRDDDMIQVIHGNLHFKRSGYYEVVIEHTDYSVEKIGLLCIKDGVLPVYHLNKGIWHPAFILIGGVATGATIVVATILIKEVLKCRMIPYAKHCCAKNELNQEVTALQQTDIEQGTDPEIQSL
ncbi:uncharacterized protein LOC122808089 [Protopterus annectens]|uniref:uncharacterized protein LOC122808089 n=1 Tax=Protopterus annectens TaxID=7888 RepID=UPI001CFB5EFA|nr:uncharacterized protein LOC122808089 [Protopterus annectens]